MNIKKFINIVTMTLGLKNFSINEQKKSIKNLLRKLKERRLKIYKSSKEKLSKDAQEELDIISYQIKKGKKLLNQLNSKNKD